MKADGSPTSMSRRRASYCEIAAARLSQEVLPLTPKAAPEPTAAASLFDTTEVGA